MKFDATPLRDVYLLKPRVYGDERGFRDGGSEPQREREKQQPEQTALTGEIPRHVLSEWKETDFQSLHEQREAGDDKQGSHQDLAEIRDGLLQHDELKRHDYQQNR